MLSEEHARSLQYFHEDKGDITRYVHWDKLKPLLGRKHPELLQALHDKELLESHITKLLEDLVASAEKN